MVIGIKTPTADDATLTKWKISRYRGRVTHDADS